MLQCKDEEIICDQIITKDDQYDYIRQNNLDFIVNITIAKYGKEIKHNKLYKININKLINQQISKMTNLQQ